MAGRVRMRKWEDGKMERGGYAPIKAKK